MGEMEEAGIIEKLIVGLKEELKRPVRKYHESKGMGREEG